MATPGPARAHRKSLSFIGGSHTWIRNVMIIVFSFAKLSVFILRCQIVMVPNCPVPICPLPNCPVPNYVFIRRCQIALVPICLVPICLVPNCPAAKLSVFLLRSQIVLVPNCPVPNCPVLICPLPNCLFLYYVAKLSWCQIVWCQIVWCQIVWCQIVLVPNYPKIKSNTCRRALMFPGCANAVFNLKFGTLW